MQERIMPGRRGEKHAMPAKNDKAGRIEETEGGTNEKKDRY